MKTPVIFSLIALACAGFAAADVPRKISVQTYSKLWNDSPFTSKPPVEAGALEKDPLEDYALIGVSPIGANSYRVTLINKKQPDDRIMVFSGDQKSDFKILGVTRKSGDPLGTTVNMQAGSKTGTVRYDEKLLTLTPPAAVAPPQQNPVPGAPPVPGQPPPVPGQRQPRPRVVPPPANGAAPQQQAQPAQQNQRPSRRRN